MKKLYILLFVLQVFLRTSAQEIKPNLIPHFNKNVLFANEYVKQNYFDLYTNNDTITIVEKHFDLDRMYIEGFIQEKIYRFYNGKIQNIKFNEDVNSYSHNYLYENDKLVKINKTTKLSSSIYTYKYNKDKLLITEIEDNTRIATKLIKVKVDAENSIVDFNEYMDLKNPKTLSKSIKIKFDVNKILSLEKINKTDNTFIKVIINYENDKFSGYNIEHSNTGIYTNNFTETKEYIINDKNVTILSNLKTNHYDDVKINNYIYDEFGNWVVKFTSNHLESIDKYSAENFIVRAISYPTKTTGFKDLTNFKWEESIVNTINNAKNYKEIYDMFKELTVTFNESAKSESIQVFKDILTDELKYNTAQMVKDKNDELLMGNRINGFGELIDKDSTIFRGTFANGKRHGIGVTTGKNNYVKVIKYDTLHPNKFEYIYKANRKLQMIGNQLTKKAFYWDVVENKMYDATLNENGEISTKNILPEYRFTKDRKEGCGMGDCNNGIGFLVRNNNTYFGSFKDGLIDGFGIMRKKSREIYLGQFIKGKKEGVGTTFHTRTQFFSGEYKNGIPDGLGFLYNDDDNVYLYAKWLDDKFLNIIQTNIPKDKL